MKSFETPLGYTVVETVYGLDVYDKDTYLCELYGKTLADYTYDGEVNGDKIEDDVHNELYLEETMN
jgi:hypothetical protein